MAYRFNPPPNWPIEDQDWTPPPGWQPDPAWGPAPEGWNFWIDVGAPADEGPVEETGPADDPGPTDDADPAAEAADAAVTDEHGPGEDPAPAAPTPTEQPQDPSGYGAPDYGPAAPSYGDAAPSYDQAGGAYAQGAPAYYGQESPYQAYGQGSPAYPAPGSPAPGMDGGSSWTAATGPGAPPQKGIVARFWWLGCIVLFLVFVLIVALVGGILLFGGDDETSSGDPTTTATQSDPSEEASPTEEVTEEATQEATEDGQNEVVTPTDLPTVDEAAEPIDIVSANGAGTLAVSMEWLPAEELPSQFGDTVTPSDEGEYLVATANLTVTEGQMEFYSFFFEVVTPYGGTLSMDSASYELAGSGLDLDAPDTFSEGEEYSIRMLFAPSRAGGMQLQYDNYTDVYSWDVPA